VLWALGAIGPAAAGAMPILPDLPPLPTNYQSVREAGPYGGAVAGASATDRPDRTLGLVLGYTFDASQFLFGVEAMALVTRGSVTVDAGLRGGLAISDEMSVHGYLGLGYSSTSQQFAVVGASAEVLLNPDVAIRSDYRYLSDLTGDASVHQVLLGIVRKF
jgi:hypothetical protein